MPNLNHRSLLPVAGESGEVPPPLSVTIGSSNLSFRCPSFSSLSNLRRLVIDLVGNHKQPADQKRE